MTSPSPNEVHATLAPTSGLSESRRRAAQWTVEIHDALTGFFTRLDAGGTFAEDRWERDGGGGGVSRVLIDGTTFEKAGVNRSTVWGSLPIEAAKRLGGRYPADATGLQFFASGVSVVVHPRSPMIPTVHFNVRYFEITGPDGAVADAWFGGGTDLTPFQPQWRDARDFHVALHHMCSRFHPSLYPRFKAWCDRYFVNAHRGGEARGVGGIFYDHVRPGEDESHLDSEGWFEFARGVAQALQLGYAPIVERHRDDPYGDREVHFQRLRRGRYVEFNLVHDRGTIFGLQTGARIESVLMSLPPEARWDYNPTFEAGSPEAEFMEMLRPRDWLTTPVPT
jgi:coproporphyrinogen III oxidase